MNIENKADLRRRMMTLRNGMAKNEVSGNSFEIMIRLMNLDVFKKAAFIMCYMSFGNEVQTYGIIKNALAMGKRVALPVIRTLPDENRTVLLPVEIDDADFPTVKGAMCVSEPAPGSSWPAAQNLIDIVLVPGVAFDKSLKRLGFGKGYYDAFLPKLRPDCLKIGLCHELQLLADIPADIWDISMDAVLTESQIISSGRIL